MENITNIVNDYGESVVQVDGDIPVDLPATEGDRFLFISHDQSYLTHGLHKYPAKFFPELPRWLIRRYSQEYDQILDPFASSGTTNVEALLSKRNSVGIDVDPFSRFLSKVKVTPLPEKELKLAQKFLLEAILNYDSSQVTESDLPDFPYRDNWFNTGILFEVAYLRKQIQGLDTSSEIKNFFTVCLSSIIRSVSNADDNCTRTVIRKKLNKLVKPSDALNRFSRTVLTKVPKMVAFSENYPSDITVEFPEDMDARNIKFEEDYFHLAVTSPPYVNAVDYPRTHQLEMYWLIRDFKGTVADFALDPGQDDMDVYKVRKNGRYSRFLKKKYLMPIAGCGNPVSSTFKRSRYNSINLIRILLSRFLRFFDVEPCAFQLRNAFGGARGGVDDPHYLNRCIEYVPTILESISPDLKENYFMKTVKMKQFLSEYGIISMNSEQGLVRFPIPCFVYLAD